MVVYSVIFLNGDRLFVMLYILIKYFIEGVGVVFFLIFI